MKKDLSIVIIIPAYNAASTLRSVFLNIPSIHKKKIVVVDDGSVDQTFEVAKNLGAKVIRHSQNHGCGGAQKSGLKFARSVNADVAIILHADNQYDPKLIPHFLETFINEGCDILLASRMLKADLAIKGGMPRWKFLCNRLSTILINSIARSNLSEFHTGYRLYGRRVFEELPFEKYSEDHVFDVQILLNALYYRMKIKELPIQSRYFPEASSMNIWESIKYGLDILKILLLRVSKYKKKLL